MSSANGSTNGATSGSEGGRAIKASVLHGARDLRLEQRHLPAPEPHELQVAVRATGLCGSDLHYYQQGKNGDILVQEPLSLGHESAGIVTAVGNGVSNFKVGDHVALEVGLPCQACARCSEGRYNLCKGMSFRSSARRLPHFQGTLQERINHPAEWCYKLPPSVSLELGALSEPLAVAMHAVQRSHLQPGSKVLIFGAGAIGLLTAASSKLSSAAEVVVADIDDGRLEFAIENKFADFTYHVPLGQRQSSPEAAVLAAKNQVAQMRKPDGSAMEEFDVVFECTGVPSCAQAAIFASRPGGKVMLVGMGSPIQSLPVAAAQSREVDLLGVFRYAGTYTAAIEALARSSTDGPDLSKLVTHTFEGLEAAEEAFAMAGKTRSEDGHLVLKVVIRSND